MRRVERRVPIAAALVAMAVACPAMAAPSTELTAPATASPPVVIAAAPRPPADPARLAIATEIAALMMPPGALRQSMQTHIDRLNAGVRNGLLNAPLLAFVRAAGIKPDKPLRVDEATATKAMTTLDPAFGQRQLILFDAVTKRLTAIIADHEPVARAAMAQAYAYRLSTADLAGLLAFLKTPAGTAFAAAMPTLTTDPAIAEAGRILGQRFETATPAIKTEVMTATRALPRPRRYADLTEIEKAAIFKLIGATPSQSQAPPARASPRTPALTAPVPTT